MLTRLENHGIVVYRMAEAGTIIAKSDGDNIEFDKNASSAQKTSSKQNNNKSTENKQSVKANQKTKPDTDVVEEVYITNTGKKYHRADCRHLKSSKIPISLAKSKQGGYKPCKTCNSTK